MPSETKALTDLLLAYKRLPCLWDQSDKNYRKRKARKVAMDILIEKYRLIQSDADAKIVKEKIEYLRNSYRREWKKVVESRLTPGAKKYIPTLWYYPYLEFLNRDAEPLTLVKNEDRDDSSDNLPLTMPESPKDYKEPGLTKEQQHLIELIETFKSFPFLWDETHRNYRNKPVREEAFLKLLEKYKSIATDANVEMVKSKLGNMRSTYGGERRKVVQSGLTPGAKEYIPTLWYYPYLEFLNRDAEPLTLVKNEDRDDSSDNLPLIKPKLPKYYEEPALTKEQQHLIEFIETFKGFTFLWDETHINYRNWPAREEAYLKLLEKYKYIVTDANVEMMKSKIASLRNTCGMERRRVISRGPKYKPTLWYYPYMSFLNEGYDRKIKTLSRSVENRNQEKNIIRSKGVYDDKAAITENGSDKRSLRKPHEETSESHEINSLEALNIGEAIITTLQKTEKSEIDIDGTQEEIIPSSFYTYDEIVPNDKTNNENNEEDEDNINNTSSGFIYEVDMNDESEVFGRIVGLHLKELNEIQQVVAEKLITEILEKAKMETLMVNSFVQLNEEPHC